MLQLELVCRTVRETEALFGGLQVLFVLDARQLPPVPDQFVGDEGLYCFQSDLWCRVFKHHVRLEKNYRTTDSKLQELIEDCFRGSMSSSSMDTAFQLERPLPTATSLQSTHLFGTNYECLLHNSGRLEKLAGEATIYTSVDEGNVAQIDGHRVPKKLVLKVSINIISITTTKLNNSN